MADTFVPTADVTGTLGDGRKLQLAKTGVALSVADANKALPDGALEVWAIQLPKGSEAITAALTLSDYAPLYKDTGVAGISTVNPVADDEDVVYSYAGAAAGSGYRHALHQIDLSYDGTPTGGNVQVEDGAANIIWTRDVDVATNGQVASIAVGSGGSGYLQGSTSVVISGGGGQGATAVATVVAGAITAITVNNPGQDYTSAPTVTITGSGSGATATAAIGGPSKSILFDPPLLGSPETALIVTLAAGGTGVTGALNVRATLAA